MSNPVHKKSDFHAHVYLYYIYINYTICDLQTVEKTDIVSRDKMINVYKQNQDIIIRVFHIRIQSFK